MGQYEYNVHNITLNQGIYIYIYIYIYYWYLAVTNIKAFNHIISIVDNDKMLITRKCTIFLEYRLFYKSYKMVFDS
jgi:hypothetical protein